MRRSSPFLASTGWSLRADLQRPPDRRCVSLDQTTCWRGFVDREFGRGVEVDRDVVRLAVGGLELVGQVGHRPRQQVDVLRQRRRHERQRQRHARAFERVDRPRRQHGQARLLRAPARRPGLAPITRYALPSMRTRLVSRCGLPGPVRRVRVGQVVGRRPDAEIRIARHQRRGGRHELGALRHARGAAACRASWSAAVMAAWSIFTIARS